MLVSVEMAFIPKSFSHWYQGVEMNKKHFGHFSTSFIYKIRLF